MKAGDIVRRITTNGTLVGAYYMVHKTKGNELLASSPAGDKPVVLNKDEFVKIPKYILRVNKTTFKKVLNGLRTIEREPSKNWEKVYDANGDGIIAAYNVELDQYLYFEYGNVTKVLRTNILRENRFGQLRQLQPLIRVELKTRIWL